MTLTDSLAELWAPGAPQLQLTNVHVPLAAGYGVKVSTSHPDALACEVLDAAVRITLAPQSEPRTIAVTATTTDAVAIWRPGSGTNRAVVPPSWVASSEHGPFSGICMGSLVNRDGRSLLSFGATVGDGRLHARSGMVEESAQLLFLVETDDADQPLSVVLALGDNAFSESVRALGRHLGLSRPEVTASNRAPVLCTWYSFHQALTADGVLSEAALAAELGFGTVIVDDGWQNIDAERGYGSCGDWALEPSKIPDGARFVDRLHDLGLKVLWWVGTPFIGLRSAAYSESVFPALYEEAGMDAAVLDPRSPSARQRLTSRLAALVRSTQADGLKLDFLERFAVYPPDAPSDADETDPGRAALTLIDEIREATRIHGAEPMIEFREPYLSPQTIPRASMLRVGDCPLSPIQNRLGILDLRLATSGIAIHSDPIMWSPGDSAERVAQHLLSSMFAVPQISVRLAELPPSQHQTLRHWLQFWNEHAALLLNDTLTVGAVEQNYPIAEVHDETAALTVQYSQAVVDVPHGEWAVWYLINSDAPGVVLNEALPPQANVEIFDCTGAPVSRDSAAGARIDRLPVPTGGYARIIRSR